MALYMGNISFFFVVTYWWSNKYSSSGILGIVYRDFGKVPIIMMNILVPVTIIIDGGWWMVDILLPLLLVAALLGH